MDDYEDFEVGYGKPPKHSQFKKGQSGNLAGRPKKRKSGRDLIREALDAEIIVNGKKMTKGEAIVISMAHDAIKGDSRARAAFLPFLSADHAEPEDFDANEDDQIELMKIGRLIAKKMEEAP